MYIVFCFCTWAIAIVWFNYNTNKYYVPIERVRSARKVIKEVECKMLEAALTNEDEKSRLNIIKESGTFNLIYYTLDYIEDISKDKPVTTNEQ